MLKKNKPKTIPNKKYYVFHPSLMYLIRILAGLKIRYFHFTNEI